MISLRNGEEIKANIKEVSDREVVFTYDKETVMNKLPTAQIAQIKFKSGRVQKFELANQQNYEPYNSPANHSPYSFNIPEPDYVGTVLLLDESGKVLGTLENQKVASYQGRKDRSIVVSESFSLGGTKSNDLDYLSFKAYAYKSSSFLIELNIDQAGEYAVALDGLRSNLNLFGID